MGQNDKRRPGGPQGRSNAKNHAKSRSGGQARPKSRKVVDIHRKARRERAKTKHKLYAIAALVFFCFVYLAYAIIDIKVINGAEYEAKAIMQLTAGTVQSEQTIIPNRGGIVDRNMNNLAVSTMVYTIFIDPRLMVYRKDENLQKTLQAIHEILGTPMETLEDYTAIENIDKDEDGNITKITARYDNNHQVIAREVPREMYMLLEEANLQDVYGEPVSKRSYPHDAMAASLIGFIRGDTAHGLEQQYDKELTGISGRVFRAYAKEGSVVTEKIEAQNGHTLVTTLDMVIQKIADDAAFHYGELYDAQDASVIVMEPDTGAILAMSQYPSFNLNAPDDSAGITKTAYQEAWAQLPQNELYEKLYGVWKNYNITSTFEPGSIFKPITVASALEEGIVSTSSTFYCGGVKRVANYDIHCHHLAGHGMLTLTESLAQSCNVAMMDIAAAEGRDIFYRYQRDFGYGEKTGIDLPSEQDASGLLYPLSKLNEAELATCSFGQRFNATPIQAITSFAALINGGNLMQPYVVSRIIDQNGAVVEEHNPTVVRKVITQETSDYLRKAMEATVNIGTGQKARIDGWSIGGKTGTAELGVRGTESFQGYALSFVGYFPVENPQYIVLVLINKPQLYVDGQTSPGPMLKEVIQNIINYKSIPPSYGAEANTVMQDSGDVAMENFVGQNLASATIRLNELSLGYELIGGSGATVIRQFPAEGVKVPKNATVLLTIGEGDQTYEMTMIPDVTGLTQQQAQDMLAAMQLTSYVQVKTEEQQMISEAAETAGQATEGSEYCKVLSQMPEPDKQVMTGTQVKLIVQKAGAEPLEENNAGE